jgi:hypothetical protein
MEVMNMFEVDEESLEQLQSEFTRWRNVAVVELNDRYYSYKFLDDIRKKMKSVQQCWIEVVEPYTLRIDYRTKAGKGQYEIREIGGSFPPQHVVKGTWNKDIWKWG